MIKIFKLDWILLAATMLLVVLSLAILFPISYDAKTSSDATNHFFRQIIFAGIGTALLVFFAFADYRNLRSHSTELFLFGLVLLFLVLIFGKVIRGTTGWIGLFGIHVQPVEPFKIIIAVALAKYFSVNSRTVEDYKHILVSLVPLALSLFLIILQPDLGSAVVILFMWLCVLLIGGVKKKYLAMLLILGILLGIFSWGYLLKDYQKDRVRSVVNPASDPLGAGYNVIQSTVAVGSGGFWGKGLGHGSQSQLNFLPEKHTDFIFAVVSEELGLGGAFFVLILFAIIMARMISIAQNSRDNFGKLIVSSFAAVMFVQIIVNVGMNVGIMPIAGIPLPLMSYGGSSLITTLAMIGIAQNVKRNSISS